MKTNHRILFALLGATALTACTSTRMDLAGKEGSSVEKARQFYLPTAEGSKVVSVTNAGPANVSIVIQTHRAAVKETGPKETIARFGEVYSFSPNFVAVHRDEPTQIRFWNLQPDDVHDFMLADPEMNVLMSLRLPPVKETAWVFTFHKEGLYNFFCAMHPPGMAGQILVLPPR